MAAGYCNWIRGGDKLGASKTVKVSLCRRLPPLTLGPVTEKAGIVLARTLHTAVNTRTISYQQHQKIKVNHNNETFPKTRR